MAFRVLTLIRFYLTSGQVPHLRFHNLSPYCISLVLPDTISVTPEKFCSVQQIKVARDQVQSSMIFEIKCKDLEFLYFKSFFLIILMCNNAFIVLLAVLTVSVT